MGLTPNGGHRAFVRNKVAEGQGISRVASAAQNADAIGVSREQSVLITDGNVDFMNVFNRSINWAAAVAAVAEGLQQASIEHVLVVVCCDAYSPIQKTIEQAKRDSRRTSHQGHTDAPSVRLDAEHGPLMKVDDILAKPTDERECLVRRLHEVNQAQFASRKLRRIMMKLVYDDAAVELRRLAELTRQAAQTQLPQLMILYDRSHDGAFESVFEVDDPTELVINMLTEDRQQHGVVDWMAEGDLKLVAVDKSLRRLHDLMSHLAGDADDLALLDESAAWSPSILKLITWRSVDTDSIPIAIAYAACEWRELATQRYGDDLTHLRLPSVRDADFTRAAYEAVPFGVHTSLILSEGRKHREERLRQELLASLQDHQLVTRTFEDNGQSAQDPERVASFRQWVDDNMPRYEQYDVELLAVEMGCLLLRAKLEGADDADVARTTSLQELDGAMFALPRCLTMLAALCGCDFVSHRAHCEFFVLWNGVLKMVMKMGNFGWCALTNIAHAARHEDTGSIVDTFVVTAGTILRNAGNALLAPCSVYETMHSTYAHRMAANALGDHAVRGFYQDSPSAKALAQRARTLHDWADSCICIAHDVPPEVRRAAWVAIYWTPTLLFDVGELLLRPLNVVPSDQETRVLKQWGFSNEVKQCRLNAKRGRAKEPCLLMNKQANTGYRRPAKAPATESVTATLPRGVTKPPLTMASFAALG